MISMDARREDGRSRVGMVIGKKGAVIRAIRTITGARIDVTGDSIRVSGRREAVNNARRIIESRLQGQYTDDLMTHLGSDFNSDVLELDLETYGRVMRAMHVVQTDVDIRFVRGGVIRISGKRDSRRALRMWMNRLTTPVCHVDLMPELRVASFLEALQKHADFVELRDGILKIFGTVHQGKKSMSMVMDCCQSLELPLPESKRNMPRSRLDQIRKDTGAFWIAIDRVPTPHVVVYGLDSRSREAAARKVIE